MAEELAALEGLVAVQSAQDVERELLDEVRGVVFRRAPRARAHTHSPDS